MAAVASTTMLAQAADSLDGTDAAVIVGTVIGVLVVGRLARLVFVRALFWIAGRALTGAHSRWRTRVPRLVAESIPVAELRRRQRIESLGLALSRLVKGVAVVVGAVVVLDRFQIDLVLAVGGLGFLIAAMAVGGQHSVHDYVNGLHALLEDRYGQGDLIRFTTPAGTLVEGRVVGLGSFGTRIETEEGTVHVANRLLTEVHNLSQRAYPRMFDVAFGSKVERAEVGRLLGAAARQVLRDASAGVVVDHGEDLGVERGRHRMRVAARFDRSLTDDELTAIVTAVERSESG